MVEELILSIINAITKPPSLAVRTVLLLISGILGKSNVSKELKMSKLSTNEKLKLSMDFGLNIKLDLFSFVGFGVHLIIVNTEISKKNLIILFFVLSITLFLFPSIII